MSIDKMQKEFDEWYFRRYGSRDLTQTWEHAVYQDALEVWKASRESLVVELPKIVDKEWACTLAECSAMRDAIGMCKKRIESLGLRVKP